MKKIILLIFVVMFIAEKLFPAKSSQSKVMYYGVFKPVSLLSIEPTGWLKQFLKNQRNGLTGHIEAAGYPFNSVGWAGPIIDFKEGESWWPYEQTAYWIDGAIRCGYLLRDDFLIQKARKHTDYVLNHPDSSGFLGPVFLKKEAPEDLWPYVVFFRALMAQYSATKDQKIVNAVVRHFLNHHFNLCGTREQCNIESILWAYSLTGEKRLLELAEKTFCCYNFEKHSEDMEAANNFLKENTPLPIHGVTYNETAKLGALLYMYTGKKEYLQYSISAYKKIDNFYLMVDGVNVSSEILRTPPDALESHEMCDVSDYTWSLGYLLEATGDCQYADKIEKAIFNAGPGQVTGNFKALQYFSSPNQVIADNHSNHNIYYRGGEQMRYAPNPWRDVECCPGNVNRFMPNFAARLWMKDTDGGIVAAMYAPSKVTANVGNRNVEVKIEEETKYPFEDEILFRFSMNEAVEFPFTVRIPGWSVGTEIYINGTKIDAQIKSGFYFTIRRKFRDGDLVRLYLPSEFRLSHWPNGGVALEKGPLVFALKIEENWQVDTTEFKATKEFPAYQLYAKSPWNYALCLDEDKLDEQIKVVKKKFNLRKLWSVEGAPIELRVPAKRVNGWKIIEQDSVHSERSVPVRQPDGSEKWERVKSVYREAHYRFTPPLPKAKNLKNMLSDKIETITLIPYGCSKLRITIFPDAADPKIF